MGEAPDLRRGVVAIGGESRFALEQVVRSLPASTGRAYVIAYTGVDDFLPSARLASPLPVVEVAAGELPRPDHVYVAPPEREVVFERGAFGFADPTVERRAPLDRLFRTLADELGRAATGIVLAGNGIDGTLGIKRIKEVGGLTIAQAPTDADYPAMPLAAIATGMIDLILPAAEIAIRLGSLVDLVDGLDDTRYSHDELAETLRDILTLVRIRTGHDFTYYKRATLYRRLARRMQVCEVSSIADYHRHVRERPNELMSLVHDFLISVTNFFRDPETFEALERLVIPKLFAGRDRSEHIRVWVSGCASGEEAYSIGMLLLEHASQLREPPGIQIFATDIDEGALANARTGRYSEAIAVDVSPERLDRFFVREASFYRVRKELRELALFSPHNVLRDPPFSRLDLVSCRNMLIYFDREAQQRALSMFHFGLRKDGCLFLGASESAENGGVLFTALDAKARLFTRRPSPSPVSYDLGFSGLRWPMGIPAAIEGVMNGDRSPSSFGELHHRIVEHYAPPSVLLNEDLEVVHVSEHASRFLALPGGEPTRQILRLVHPGLRLELRSAIYRARQVGRAGDTRVVRFDDDGRAREIEIRVQTVDKPDVAARLLLVMFDERDGLSRVDAHDLGGERVAAPVVDELEAELQRTRDQLRQTIEQYETSVEELKASNEELHAINEEVRSASEELETSKEELQSVNEELSTVNHELKLKVDELGRANGDLQNLMTSTDIAVVFLDRTLHVGRFTPRARDLFNIIPSDIGRPFAHLTHKLDCHDLAESALEVLEHLHHVEREVRTRDGGHFLARILPYRSLEDRIEGVVLTFIDVTELTRAQDALRASDGMLHLAERTANMGIWTIDAAARRIRMSDECARLHGFEPSAEVALDDWFGRVAETDRERVRGAVDAAAGGAELSVEYQLTHPAGPRWLWSLGRAPADRDVEGTLAGIAIDVTDRRRAERSLRESDRRKDEFLATLSHELRNPLNPLRVALDLQQLHPSDAEEVQRTGAIMDRQVDHLIRLVDDLLDLSRITQGKVELAVESLDASALALAAVEDTRMLFESAGHHLDLQIADGPLQVRGDRTRLIQILVNLLTNAAKYTPDGGEIALEVRASAGRVVFAVRDNGVGIAADDLPTVFDLYTQCRDARGRTRGGLGIGLNLVLRMVELHGGRVSARSAGLGCGSEFVVEIPMES